MLFTITDSWNHRVEQELHFLFKPLNQKFGSSSFSIEENKGQLPEEHQWENQGKGCLWFSLIHSLNKYLYTMHCSSYCEFINVYNKISAFTLLLAVMHPNLRILCILSLKINQSPSHLFSLVKWSVCTTASLILPSLPQPCNKT